MSDWMGLNAVAKAIGGHAAAMAKAIDGLADAVRSTVRECHKCQGRGTINEFGRNIYCKGCDGKGY